MTELNKKRSVYTLLALACAVLTAFGIWQGCFRSGSTPKTNIILITLDTTRADRLGCYGAGKAITPHIDKIAADGVRFDLAIAQAAVTPVSHASILTGLYPFEHGLRVLHGTSCYKLEEGIFPTLATILRDRGWSTAAFVSSFPVSEYFGLDQGFDVFETGLSGNTEEIMQIDPKGRANWGVDENQRRADVTTDQALAWLAGEEDLFFMWLHFFDPHDNCLMPPRTVLKEFAPQFLDPKFRDPRARARALYDAEVAFMDRQIGRLVDHLKATGRWDNTLIVITNDHGEGLGDHQWWYHRILYQEQIRMPLVIRTPQPMEPHRQVVEELVRSIDIMPTILEYVGITPPRMSGRSLIGLMQGEPEPERVAYADALIRLDSNRPQHAEKSLYDDLMYCVMTRSWKLIHRHFQPELSELYRIDKDPGELENLIDDFADKQAELLEFLEQPGVMIEKLIPMAEDSEARRRLEALGY